jgi:hypothetical protein
MAPESGDAAGSDTGGGDGGGGDAQTDPCVDTPDDPKCLDESTALFVSAAKGNDADNLGTRDKPFKTLGGALDRLTPTRRRIYVCDGTYGEDVVLGAAHTNVSILGGFACDWTASTNKPVFGNGPMALEIVGTSGLAISNIAFEAKDATAAGGSSIAAFVRNASVTFKSVALTAGKGMIGADGTLTPFNNLPSATDLKGNDGAVGAAEKSVTCPGGLVTKGGKGGPVGGFPGESGTPGPDNKSTSICSGAGSVDTNGAPGSPTSPAQGAAAIGELLDDGWKPQAGPNGATGNPGQGGGGGFSGGGGVGGGGGAGGCGGAGGGGGKGGGGSIAIASLQSTIQMSASTLTAKNAGGGGAGVAGQPGQTPGGARGVGTGTSCNGGNGGNGGDGATGGGGAGGVSVGVLYKGPQPTLDSTTTSAITVGTKGAAGGGPGNKGIEGVAAPTLEAN